MKDKPTSARPGVASGREPAPPADGPRWPLWLQGLALPKLFRLELLPKTLLIMTFGWYEAGGHGATSYGHLLLAFLALGPVLWSGLYALNQVTDAHEDAADPGKAHRPIPSGQVSRSLAMSAAVVLIVSGLVATALVSRYLFVVGVLMSLSQFAYCLRPVRLKHRPFLDLAPIAIVNPALRFLAGYAVVAHGFGMPPLAGALLFSGHLAGSIAQRYLSRTSDLVGGHATAATVLVPRILRVLTVTFAAIAVGSFLGLAVLGASSAETFWGSIPVYSVFTIMPGLLVIPYAAAALNESRCDSLPLVRRYAWAAFAVFAAAMLPLFLLFPR